jgi:hypothetical protein
LIRNNKHTHDTSLTAAVANLPNNKFPTKWRDTEHNLKIMSCAVLT